ncbi:response regulator [Reichenbachiella agarivorans]|uniref:histidine kinase n=1 Tax=Reichenbachiella agarivorans TaxID=2979464 RepID=A0ABY6CMG6_9BACT|nr:response regulator [Reichenbachiella agarivorans]UXP31704.1 response regulator [Reichenbachiella agarivorans]
MTVLEEELAKAIMYSKKVQTDSCALILDKLETSYELLSSEQKLEYLYLRTDHTYETGNYLNSIEYARAYINLLEMHPTDSTKKEAILVYLGLNYYMIDELGLSIDTYYEALKIYQEKQDQFGIILCYLNLGKAYSDLKEYDKSLQYITKAIQGLKKLPEDSHRLSSWYSQLASVLISSNDLENARLYLDSALRSSENNNHINSLPEIYGKYGFMYKKKGEIQKAIENYQLAIDLAEELGDAFKKIELMNQLANTYNLNGYFDESISLLEPFLKEQLAQKSYQTRLTELETRLYYAYEGVGRYKDAIDLHEQFKYLRDSIKSLENFNQIKQASIRSMAAQHESENTLLKKQDELNQQTIKAQNTILISGLIVLLLVIIIAVIIYRASVINKKLSLENKRQADRLIQLDIAKSRFFANISHDLRTPMTLIMGGITQVLENKEVYLTAKAEKQLRIGLRNGERIIHLTNEINELIKLEDNKLAITPRYINVDEMLNLFVQMFSSAAEIKGVHLAYSRMISKGSTIIYADPYQFEKVLFNLITNGLKHIREKDSLTVSLSQEEDKLCISILDTGEGIPEENIPYIFDRYYQAPGTTFKTQEGFGIGLALVKEIIDKHNASIQVKSQLGTGTEFRIKIRQENIDPAEVTAFSKLDYSDDKRNLFRDIDEVETEAKPLVHIESIKNLSSNKRKKTILIVEDHPEVRDYIFDLISEYYTVLTASNGQRAIKVLEKESIDLIITDLMMPWFDGFELLDSLRQDDKLKKIPALVLSARTSEEDKEKVLNKGVNDILSKPFNPKELLVRIENLLNKKEWNNTKDEALFINNQETLDEVESSILKNVEQLILKKIDDPNLSVTYLSDQVFVSERKFYRLIKKLTNTTPYEYIKEVRLQYANKLIQEKKLSNSSEVARLIGMNNVSHFNTQFKKRFGKKPSELLQK